MKYLSNDNWSLGVSLITLIIAVVAILVAIRQLKVGRTETRGAQAHETYQQYPQGVSSIQSWQRGMKRS